MKKKFLGSTSLQILRIATIVELKEKSYIKVVLNGHSFLVSTENNGTSLELKNMIGQPVASLELTERGLIKLSKLHEKLFNSIQETA